MHKHVWRQANIRLIPCAILLITGASISSIYGDVRVGSLDHKLVALSGVLVFVVFSIGFLNVFSNAIRLVSLYHLGAGRAAALEFFLRIIGYITIILITLRILEIPVGRLLLGSAVLGIILGVAAQQALANFFASIILILSHPFSVGEEIMLNSGALGGKYMGLVVDIGLTHTQLKEEDGNIVFLPNATLLSGAAIRSKSTHRRSHGSQQ